MERAIHVSSGTLMIKILVIYIIIFYKFMSVIKFFQVVKKSNIYFKNDLRKIQTSRANFFLRVHISPFFTLTRT